MRKSRKERAFLKDFIQRTDPDTADLPEKSAELRALAQKTLNRLRTPIRFIIAGEFSSGKSTLANMLVGQELIPTSVLASNMPPLLFRYGRETLIAAGWHDKNPLKKFDRIDFDAALAEDPDFILVNMPSPILKRINFFDMPGTGDPLNDNRKTRQLVKSAEGLIWCTNAVQAWRESERYTWSNHPSMNRSNSILVVTHVDLPVAKRNLERMMERVRKDAGKHFKAVLPIAIPEAIKAASEGEVQGKSAWTDSGAKALLEAIETIANPIRQKKRSDAATIIEEKLKPFIKTLEGGATGKKPDPAITKKSVPHKGIEPDSVVDALKHDLSMSEFTADPDEAGRAPDPREGIVKPLEPAGKISFLDGWNRIIESLVASFKQSDDAADLIQSCCDIVMEMTDTIIEADPQTGETEWVTSQFQDALDLLILMQLETGDEPLETSAILLLQLSRDLAQIETTTQG